MPVLAGVFGIGCDGELTPAEVLERLAEVAAAGGLAGVRGLTEPVVERLDAAVAAVPTEASAQALRCFRGELGETTIRAGRRAVQLSPVGAMHRLPGSRRGGRARPPGSPPRYASAPTWSRPTPR